MVGDRPTRPEVLGALTEFELSRPAVPETVTAFRHRAATFAAEQGAHPDLTADIALAVSEATANAVKYAYRSAGTGTIELSASAEDGRLTLLISDCGEGFREGSSEGLGLGLTIIADVCHDLEIVQGEPGTQVLMRFLLPRE
ncbi:MAG TPA: ATP-binding protein [Solirubrobacterales bacterium]|nr:ATP-binding protein [Solirubrobacterales bacterium]